MNFSDATTFFDDTLVYEAYSGVFSFYGQMDLYDGSERDSTTSSRRSLSVASDITIPASNTVAIGGDSYLVGNEIKDFFHETTIRKHFILHPSNIQAQVRWPKALLDATTSTAIYAAKSWRKQSKDELQTSNVFQIYNLYFTADISLVVGQIVSDGVKLYNIAGVGDTSAGYQLAMGYELDIGAHQTVTYQASGATYNPVTDSKGYSIPMTIQVLLDRFKVNYELNFPSSEKFKIGDKVITVSETDVAEPKVGDLVSDSFRTYRTVSVVSDYHGAWLLHAEPV